MLKGIDKHGDRLRVDTSKVKFNGEPKIDYKDVRLLQGFVSERGRIVPSRITSASGKKQRELNQAIKRARFLGLLPYIIK
ncbi:30S ribosomal protein S18 [Sphingomonas sp. RT2P30]